MRQDRFMLAVAAIGLTVAGATAFSTPVPSSGTPSANALSAAVTPVGTAAPAASTSVTAEAIASKLSAEDAFIARAIDAVSSDMGRLSTDEALEMAFRAWYTFSAAHPDRVQKPYLYFVDYGLGSTDARGYVFNMESLTVVEGPFPVAHGRGSSKMKDAVPSTFSNRSGSAATSLGLYVGAELYGFTGKAGGKVYHSTGMRMDGVSGRYNSAARARRVVAHGAPYVTATKAGRSEGCPAMDPARAKRLLPLIADGGLIFLYSPNEADWVANDPWGAA